ncbi:MAG TPA: AMP-dependent synthetase/ligase [Solirubrobacteraceae bacterium]|nr:AMP-dependent synthetase/ligase [Solirubrobacteraceae bacterium]
MGDHAIAAPARRALGARTMTEAFRLTVEDHPDHVALRTKDDELALTWAQLRDRVDALAGGLAGLGVRRGDTVALMLGNRPEFAIADLAVLTLGATPFSIYQTFTPGQIAHVVGDAGAKLAIVEQAYLERFLAARAELPAVDTVVVLEGAAGPGTVGWDDVEGADPGFDAEPHWRAAEPEDVLTLIYTSGTTGPPKGVQLVHRNVMAMARTADAVIRFPDGSKVISWLPAAHIAERNAHHYIPIVFAMTVTFCPNPREIVAYLPAVRPTWFFAVPRIFEKLKAGLEGHLSTQGEQTVGWLTAARRKVELEQAGEPVPEDVAATAAEGEEQLFAGLRAMLGLDEALAINAGAAPTPRDVLVFFHAIGIRLGELWGMSETTGVGAVNPPDRVRIGTVGPPSLGVEVRLAEDGELLVRGDVVMTGYRNRPEQTAEAIDADGWLHTGDIATIADDGYISIVDRKKEIIINAAGKNMSPANIESTLKGAGPVIGHVAVIGDRRPYNTALIVLDSDFAPALAAQHGIEERALERLAGEESIVAAVQAAVDKGNAELARVEQIKKFTIVPGDWLPGGDELTPTMKLKRKPIAEKYEAEIEAMYAA